jgi:predicted nuclease of predicted toxin-antitoxin system
MALLIDENISHRIVAKLIDYFPETIHARQIQSSRLNDFKIFKFAQENNLIIVTRDEDFRHLQRIHGAPPKIIWLRTANSSTLNILHKLVAKKDDIDLLAREEETDLLEIY